MIVSFIESTYLTKNNSNNDLERNSSGTSCSLQQLRLFPSSSSVIEQQWGKFASSVWKDCYYVIVMS